MPQKENSSRSEKEMNEMIYSKSITVYFPDERLYDLVVQAAGEERRSKSSYVLGLIIKELTKGKKNESNRHTKGTKGSEN